MTRTIAIESLRNSASGPAALLGSGESVLDLDIEAIAARMPIIGINRSWRRFETKWRCFIDDPHWTDMRGGVAPLPELAIFPAPVSGVWGTDALRQILGLALCPVNHLPLTPQGRRFMGFELDLGTYGAFGGLLGLEVATWVGYNPIYLLGYDNVGGHFFNRDVVPPGGEKTFKDWALLLKLAAVVLEEHGVRVINCSPMSTIGAFEKGTVDASPPK